MTQPDARRLAEKERVSRVLARDAAGFSFFQAVRLLTRLRPGRAPVGGWADASDEVVRFGSSTSLAFPRSEIQTLSEERGEDPQRMTVNFFGLVGPVGVLPHLYSEHASARARAKDTAFRDFLDLFHHRLTSLFYRAWAKYRPAITQETEQADVIQDHLLDLAGLGTKGLRDRHAIPDAAIAFYAGLLASGSRPADGLARIVSDYFGVSATVEQFVGEWRSVAAGGQCALGATDDSARLGWGILGDEGWDAESRVRLRVGPLTRAQYDAFLPEGSGHAALRALTRLYSDDAVGIDVQLVLARDEVPRCMLGSGSGASLAPTLGRATWLSSKPLLRDPDETILRLF